MGSEVFSELDQIKDFFPELDVAIDADSDYKVTFGRREYVVDGFFVHVAYFVEICGGKPI